ncbi:MAG: Homoserine O-succinyltransferase [Verrucomicrobia bacterium ADurb.Bin474]|nr:MAG: Homoserine O-succinyltransferase [Verrucomicrobia bacterium ADurb.Bin474]
MPLVVSHSEQLPAFRRLEQDRVPIIRRSRAEQQDIRPLNVGLLNLMPTAAKEATEIQYFRLLANTPLQINPYLVYFDKHKSQSSADHLDRFYRRFSEIKEIGLDGLIITGANLEHYAFEDVHYWDEFKELILWADAHVTSTIYGCWASHAGLYVHYGVERVTLGNKRLGIYSHRVHREHGSILTQNMDDVVDIPYSRWTGIPSATVASIDDLQILVESENAGIHLISSRDGRRVFVQGHPEYDRDTLKKEYERDIQAGVEVNMPENYFPDNNPSREPRCTWIANAQVFYTNWINYIYQNTNYDPLKPLMDEDRD